MGREQGDGPGQDVGEASGVDSGEQPRLRAEGLGGDGANGVAWLVEGGLVGGPPSAAG